MRRVKAILLELCSDGCARCCAIEFPWCHERLRHRAVEFQRRKPDLLSDAVWLLHPVSGGSAAHGADAGPDGFGRVDPRPDLCSRDLRDRIYYAVLPQLLRHYSTGLGEGGKG